jgi:hypothetical protein
LTFTVAVFLVILDNSDAIPVDIISIAAPKHFSRSSALLEAENSEMHIQAPGTLPGDVSLKLTPLSVQPLSSLDGMSVEELVQYLRKHPNLEKIL